MKKLILSGATGILIAPFCLAQSRWINVDSLYQPLPSAVHVFYTNAPLDTAGFTAYYLVADLKNKALECTVDTSHDRRLIPSAFFDRNNQPLLVVNCTFFSFETNRSLNTVVKNGKLVAFNQHMVRGKGKDTLTYQHPFESAIGISKKGNADIAWLYTDSSMRYAYASQTPYTAFRDSVKTVSLAKMKQESSIISTSYNRRYYRLSNNLKKWKMYTAVGGGPVLIQNGEIRITNNEELKFAGKAIYDKHPRTAIGYTKDDKLIVMVIQGRSESSSGASLIQEASLLVELGCVEALNLDGGGSSCMLVNGKETIRPSDKEGQRPVPAVFLIKSRK